MILKTKFCKCLSVKFTLFLLLLSLTASMPLALGAETHDIAITSVVKDKSSIAPAMHVNISVAVENQGTTAESFNVTVYRTNIATNQNTTVGSTSVELEAGHNETLAFVWTIPRSEWLVILYPNGSLWDTDPMIADFTIWAEANVVDGEIDTSDNVCIDGTLQVLLRYGDVDGDGWIGVFDLVRIAGSYGMPAHDPLTDYNQNGVIDIFDLVRLVANYLPPPYHGY